ncbi:hypothetical protein AUG19_03660 [archaeon 13_1_20CM_2_54_9]|nr:MAG: hypothetical protein AUG19_03660 [archaeon 13_1_20CM_2_54_9]TMI27016.1 MAG: hypothetical protein E6H36_03950 [Candidatus Bathyarchaeota archaeon]TMI30835.1 MAG: hypothetical protein E6H29_07370 [Candidatus Bathyarchaeota archaeon]
MPVSPHYAVHSGPPRIKVPYSRNPVYVAEGYKPPVVAGRSFEYETTPQVAGFWTSLSLAYRQYMKKEADTRGIDLRLLLDERLTGAFQCVGCGKPMVMRELFANGDRMYQCLNGDCVKRIIRYHYHHQSGHVTEVA